MSEIEKEILEVTGAREQKPKEKRPTYLKRIVEKVTELEDDDWEKLSTEAQEWANEGAKALNKDKPAPDFPDIEEDDEDEDESETEAEDETAEADDEAGEDEDEDEAEEDEAEEDEDEKPAARKKAKSSGRTKTRRTSTKKEPKAKASTKEKTKKPAKESKKKKDENEISITDAIKLEMLEDPTLSTGDLEDIMEEKGMKTSRFTISSIRADFKHSLKFLAKHGKLDKEIADRLSS